MKRKSTVLIKHDAVGDYAVELFDCPNPKDVVICVHGRGARREDGEQFFYAVAEHYPEHAFVLVDQNQFNEDVCLLNPLPTALARVQDAIALGCSKYPVVPIVLLSHSMGCGLTTQLELSDIAKIIFVAPTAGAETEKLTHRYGADVVNGKLTVSSDGLKKYMSKEYFDSMHGIVWEDEYRKLLARFKPVYVFESGNEEIVGEERFALRKLAFTDYAIIPGATHNLHGMALERLFSRLNRIM